MERVRILIAENNRYWMKGLCKSIDATDDLRVISTAVDGAEAIELAVELRVDVVLMDLSLQGDMDGIEASHIIKKKCDCEVIMIASSEPNEIIPRSYELEAIHYLVKTNFKVIPDIIREAYFAKLANEKSVFQHGIDEVSRLIKLDSVQHLGCSSLSLLDEGAFFYSCKYEVIHAIIIGGKYKHITILNK